MLFRNTFWADAIAKEMKEVRIAFNILPDGHVVRNGYQKIPSKMSLESTLVEHYPLSNFPQNFPYPGLC